MSRRRAPVLAVVTVLVAATLVQAAPRWGWIGVRIRDLSEQEMEEISQRHGIREGFGALIVDVIKETPAEASGLRSGDLVVAFKERLVVDTRALQRYVARAEIGEPVALTVLRREEGRRRVLVRVGPMPDEVAADRVAVEFGFVLRDAESQAEFATGRPWGPAAVAAVVPRSRAETAGLRAGDLVLEVNGRPAETLAAVREALLSAALDRPLALVVRRGAESLAVRVLAPAVPDR